MCDARWGFSVLCKISVQLIRFLVILKRKKRTVDLSRFVCCSACTDTETISQQIGTCFITLESSLIKISSIPYSMLLNFTKNFQFSAIIAVEIVLSQSRCVETNVFGLFLVNFLCRFLSGEIF